jgi:hypothetical protein
MESMHLDPHQKLTIQVSDPSAQNTLPVHEQNSGSRKHLI